jgi:hypothetical protein
MRFTKLFLVVTAIAIAAFSVGLRGQGLIDGIKVTLPEPVTVGDKVLEPGEYEIRRPSSVNRDILQIFSKDRMVYETNVLTVPTGPDTNDPKETKVVLHRIGDTYYFDKIWMEDKNYGWEFPLPERARALQRENALNVPARYQPSQATQSEPVSQSVSQPYEGPGLAAQLDAIAAQDAQQAAVLERERQDQADRDLAQRNQVAAVQNEPAPANPPQPESRVTEPQQSIQGDSEIPEQLPRTATNWVTLLLGGGMLITLSLILRVRA